MRLKIGVKKRKPKRTNTLKKEEQKLRAEARRLVSMANKRLKRLEEQDLINSPAYRQWVEDGKQKFSVRGKNMQEVRQEVARMNDFLKKKTSTVRGAKQYFQNVAREVGIKSFKDFPDLQNKLNKFFETTSKIKDYLYNSKEVGVAIGYQKIWEVVSDYIEEMGKEIEMTEDTVLEIAEKITKSVTLNEVDKMLDDWMNSLFND